MTSWFDVCLWLTVAFGSAAAFGAFLRGMIRARHRQQCWFCGGCRGHHSHSCRAEWMRLR